MVELRRVPANWEHPRDKEGNFVPLRDKYEAHCEMWLAELKEWEAGCHRDRAAAAEQGVRYFWDWEGPPPDSSSYIPKFDEPATSYQIYETVSEGTPISPVFSSEAEVIEWIVKQGESGAFAEEFVRRGGVTSTFEITNDGHREIRLLYDV
jgi:hypothetical protein